MTNANLPDRWLNSVIFDGLSDPAWRVYTYSLMYANQQGTDGLISATAVRFLHPMGVSRDVIDELVAAKLWKRLPQNAFLVTEWTESQSLAADVAAQRHRKRENQRAARARRKKTSDQDTSPPMSPVTSPIVDKTSSDQNRSGSLGAGDYTGGTVAWNGDAA